MSKERVNIQNTPLDPFAFEKQVRAVQKNSPYVTPTTGLEFVTELPVEEGYSSMGNSRYAQKALTEFKAEQQGSLELLAKGVGRTISKAGSEILKVPGYIGGAIEAAGNEVFGDGKNSMALMVDNAWINAFESMDQSLKDLMPIYLQEQVQEGNILDKLGSGAWWASQGSDGLGFMLSMFVPGAAAKLAGTGKALAGLAEVISNTKVGKLLAAPKLLGLTPEVAELAGQYRAGQAWIRGADGISAALVNTMLESSAEAAGTFDNTYKQLKERVKAGEITEEKAKELAGEKASSVFKSNMGLLLASNVLEQAWVWKAFGSNNDSVISKAFKDGRLDFDALRKLGDQSFGDLAREYATGIAKNAAKEGIFEEGLQTQIEQNAAKGRDGLLPAVNDLFSNIFGGEDEFWKNTELHESMVLGAVLGSGMGVVSQIKDINNMDQFLNGYNKANESQGWFNKFLIKSGIKQNRDDSTGIIKLLEDNFIKNFKSDLTGLQTNGNLDFDKMAEAWASGKKEEYAHLMFDTAVATGDKVNQQKWGAIIAQHYTQPFLGQPGMESVFEDHVKNDLTEHWKDRFQKQFLREANPEEVRNFQDKFIESGKQVFDAYNEASRTNFPERFVQLKSVSPTQYAKFRQSYFNLKLQTLLEFGTLRSVETDVNNEFQKRGLEAKIERTDTGYKIKESVTANEAKDIQDYFKVLKQVEKRREQLNKDYDLLFDKEAVQTLLDTIVSSPDSNSIIQQAREEKKAEVNTVVSDIAKKEEEIRSNAKPDPLNESPTGVETSTTFTKVKNKIGEERQLQVTPDAILDPETGEEIGNIQDFTLIDDAAVGDIDISDAVQAVDPNIEILSDSNPKEPAMPASEEDSQLEKSILFENTSLPITDRKTTGVNIRFTRSGNVIEDDLTDEGLPVLGSESQQRWFRYTSQEPPVTDTLVIYPYPSIKSEPDLFQEISTETSGIDMMDNDLVAVVYRNGKPLKIDDRFVFTGIARPSTIYGSEIRVAEQYIESFPGDNLSQKISAAEKEYIKWYNGFTEPTEVNINGLSDGFPLIRYQIVDGKRKVIWNNAAKNIPSGIKELIVAEDKTIIRDGRQIKVDPGNVVAYSNDGFLHRLKSDLLTPDQADVIISMLSLIETDPKDVILNDVEIPMSSTRSRKSIGVFVDKTIPLFDFIGRFSEGEGGYFVKGNVLTYHPVGQDRVSIYIRDLQKKEDREAFKNFLLTRRVQVSKKSLSIPYFSINLVNGKVNIKPTTSNKTWSDYHLNNTLRTISYIDPRYPSRIQRNLYIGDRTGRIIEKAESAPAKKSKYADRAKTAASKLDADKVFSLDEIITIKLQSGEIIKQCR